MKPRNHGNCREDTAVGWGGDCTVKRPDCSVWRAGVKLWLSLTISFNCADIFCTVLYNTCVVEEWAAWTALRIVKHVYLYPNNPHSNVAR